MNVTLNLQYSRSSMVQELCVAIHFISPYLDGVDGINIESLRNALIDPEGQRKSFQTNNLNIGKTIERMQREFDRRDVGAAPKTHLRTIDRIYRALVNYYRSES